jgi:hypothetical protein
LNLTVIDQTVDSPPAPRHNISQRWTWHAIGDTSSARCEYILVAGPSTRYDAEDDHHQCAVDRAVGC